MVNAHCADAMVCISNCDKITPGMLMAALRLNIPTVFVSGGPMEAGKVVLGGKSRSRSTSSTPWSPPPTTRSPTPTSQTIERSACPTCGSCSGMFTANSMNCLTEALGLSLPGNGSTLATHADRKRLFVEAGHLIVDLARRYYEQDDAAVLPRAIASKGAFENAMTLDIAMGGSTNTVLHILAAAHEAECRLHHGRHRPPVAARCRCSARSRRPSRDVHMEDVHRAGGIMAILGELDRAGLLDTDAADRPRRRPSATRSTSGTSAAPTSEAVRDFYRGRPRAASRPRSPSARRAAGTTLDLDREQRRASARPSTPSPRTAASPCSTATSPRTAAS